MNLPIKELSNAELTKDSSYFYSTTADLLQKYNGIDVSGNVTLSKAYIDASLGLYATNVSVGTAAFGKNASFNAYATNVSVGTAIGVFATNVSVGTALGFYATNVSIGTAAFGKNASFNAYATNVSVGTAIGPFATNVSVGTAIAGFATNVSVGTALGVYATNVSIGSAAFGKNASFNSYATNVSIGLGTFTHLYTPGSIAGLRDASGINGDFFKLNASIYCKLNGAWTHWVCTSTAFG